MQFLISPWKRKGGKSYYNTGYSYLVAHPSTDAALEGLRAVVPKFQLEVCKMKKSKIPKLCQNIVLDELFLEKIL